METWLCFSVISHWSFISPDYRLRHFSSTSRSDVIRGRRCPPSRATPKSIFMALNPVERSKTPCNRNGVLHPNPLSILVFLCRGLGDCLESLTLNQTSHHQWVGFRIIEELVRFGRFRKHVQITCSHPARRHCSALLAAVGPWLLVFIRSDSILVMVLASEEVRIQPQNHTPSLI